MTSKVRNQIPPALLCLLIVYCAASLLHFAHNAEYLADYPNMPDWLSRSKVYFAWTGVTAVGLVGYVLLRSGYQLTGLLAVAIYAALGFDGLGHYALAPISAHTIVMNATIWFEVAAGAVLFIAAVGLLSKNVRTRVRSGPNDAKY